MNYEEFLSGLSAPARRALANAGIHDFTALAQWTERELSALHGLGPKSIPLIRSALAQAGHELK